MAEELFDIKGASPAVPDLLFWRVVGHEEFSRPSVYELTVLSEKKSIDPNDIIGYPFDVIIKFHDPDESQYERHCQGHAVRFMRVRQIGRYHEYRITLRSWFWLLTKRRNSRIQQDKPVLDIIDAIFEDSSIKRFKKVDTSNVIGAHNPHRYCVQFEESDFQHISRLLEEEGIYYWFDSHDAPGTMYLSDASDVAHDKLPVLPELEFRSQDRGEVRYNEISHWTAAKRFESGAYETTDSDFKKIGMNLKSTSKNPDAHELADLEVFEFPGDFFDPGDGEDIVRMRSEEIGARRERNWAVTPWPDVAVGKSFQYKGDPDSSRDGEYIIGSCTFVVSHTGYEGLDDSAMPESLPILLGSLLSDGTMDDGAQTALREIIDQQPDLAEGGRGVRMFLLGLLPQDTPYRPSRLTPRVRMPGPQTAIVVGPEGEELHVDEFGRIKVHFHWDRYDESNEKSTCWLRVSQPWAGKEWGGYFAPRIGQEVIVQFLNGDPDRPVIMGRVYNDDQPIPYQSPTQSGFKTRSTPGGGPDNFNEFRFEDKIGQEQVFLHAERNHDIEVENDETHWVGNDRSKSIDHDETVKIGHDRTELVVNNETITIGVDRTEQVGKNESITIGANRTITVGASEAATVVFQRTHTVGVNETITIGAAQEITVGGKQEVNVGGNQSVGIGINQSTEVGKNLSTTAGGDESRSVKGNRGTDVGEKDTLQVGKDFRLNAGDSISLVTGSASITMKKNGTIVIRGKNIQFDATGKINAKASGDIVMKGSRILQN